VRLYLLVTLSNETGAIAAIS